MIVSELTFSVIELVVDVVVDVAVVVVKVDVFVVVMVVVMAGVVASLILILLVTLSAVVVIANFFSTEVDEFLVVFIFATIEVARFSAVVDDDSVTRVMKFSFLIAVLLDTTKRLRVVRMDVETVVISFVSVGPEAKSNLISL